MIRLSSVVLLAVAVSGCATQEFEHEFWLRTDGSGSFKVTAPAWVWNAVKNVGDARDLEKTVNEETVGALFKDPAILKPRVKRETRGGHSYLEVAGSFSNINSLVGTRAFPDLVVAMRPEGGRLRLFGVWRRPQSSGTAQGDGTGLMGVKFHMPSEIYSHRNASSGVERGNILSWRQNLSGGIAGSPIDFGATIGTKSRFRTLWMPLGLAVIAGGALMTLIFRLFSRLWRKRNRRRPGPGAGTGSEDDANFLNYDPTSSAR